MRDKKWFRRKILYQLMNYKRNQLMLTCLPHIRYLDMAIVFSYRDESCHDPEKYFLVTDPLREEWGFSVPELEKLAAYHTPRLMPVSFQSASSMLHAIAEDVPFSRSAWKKNIPTLILTNQKKLYGAAVILYPQLLRSVSQSFQDDLFIIPSSIHECMVVPVSIPYSRKQLETMIQSIHNTQIPYAAVLSEHVYIYRRKSNFIGL